MFISLIYEYVIPDNNLQKFIVELFQSDRACEEWMGALLYSVTVYSGLWLYPITAPFLKNSLLTVFSISANKARNYRCFSVFNSLLIDCPFVFPGEWDLPRRVAGRSHQRGAGADDHAGLCQGELHTSIYLLIAC